MKKYIIYFLLFILCGWFACTEEKEFEGWRDEDQPVMPVDPPGTPVEPVKARVAFADTVVMGLKNAGTLQIPVTLSAAQADTLYVKVALLSSENGEAGVDFAVKEWVMIPADSVVGYAEVVLLDDGKPGEGASFSIGLVADTLKGIHTAEAAVCRIGVTGNAFVAFEKTKLATYEAAHVFPNALEIPLKVIGTLTEPARIVLKTKIAGQSQPAEVDDYMVLEKDTLVLEAGATAVVARVFTVDNSEVNPDREVEVEIAEVTGGNALPGRANTVCSITVKDDETARTVAFRNPEERVMEAAGTCRVRLRLDVAAEFPVTVALTATDKSATSPEHYTLETPEVTFPAGDTIAFAEVSVVDDKEINPDRMFELTLAVKEGLNVRASLAPCYVTIVSEEVARTVRLKWTAMEVGEADGTLQIPVVMNMPAEVPVTVDFTGAYGTANEEHWDWGGASPVIQPGDTLVYMPVTIKDNNLPDGDKNFTVWITGIKGLDNVAYDPERKCTVTIKDDEVANEMFPAQTEIRVKENAGKVRIPFRLKLPAEKRVDWAPGANNGTAIFGQHISWGAGAGFDAGSQDAWWEINIIDDDIVNENREFTIFVNQVNDPCVLFDKSKVCKVIIENDDVARTLGFVNATAETKESAGKLRIPVVLSASADAAVTVDLAIKEGATAQNGTHFIAPSFLTIPAGQALSYVEIQLTDDDEVNPDREFTLVMTNPQGVGALMLGMAECRVVIRSEEVVKTLAFAKSTLMIRRDAAQDRTLDVPLTLAPAAEAQVTVLLATVAGGTAEVNTDYVLPAEPVAIAAGQTSVNVPVTVKAGTEAKTLKLKLGAVTGPNIEVSGGICEVTLQSSTVAENVIFETAALSVKENAGNVAVPVVLNQAFAEKVTVEVAAEGGVAADYTLRTSKLEFYPGQTKATVYVTLNDNHQVDDAAANWTFSVKLSSSAGNPPDVAVSAVPCAVTVVDDDFTVAFGTQAFSKKGTDGAFSVPVTISAAQEEDVTVKVMPVAVSGAYFELGQNEVTIQRGNTSVDLPVTLVNETCGKPGYFELSLASSTHNSAVLDATACRVDVTYWPEWEVVDNRKEEDTGAQTVTIRLKYAYREPLTFTLATTAVVGSHFSLGNVTIPANATSFEMPLTLATDALTAPPADCELTTSAVNGVSLPETQVVTKLTVLPCDYRKWLGNWFGSWTGEDNNAVNVNCSFSGGNTNEEKIANWRKKYFIKPFRNSDWTAQMNYEQGKLKINDSFFGQYNFDDGKGPLNGRVMYWNLDTDKGWYTGSDYLVIVNDDEIKTSPNRKFCFFWYDKDNSPIYSTDEVVSITFVRRK